MSEEWLKDARKIPDDTMDHIRKIAVRAIIEKDYSPEVIADVFGISRTAIYAWLRRYHNDGYSGLNSGQSPGVPLVITEEMDQWLKKTVCEDSPVDFGYDTMLWTREILAQLLNEKFSINVSGSAVSLHLKKMGLSYQKPWFRSYEQDLEKVDHFLNETFPRIQKLAANIGAEIAFEDEAGVGLQTHSGRTWGEIGKTPEVMANSCRSGYNILSIVTSTGKLRYSIHDGKINSDRFIEFLKQILAGRKTPLILILDRAPFHLSKKVRDFVRSRRKEIRIYFLPSYSPELNPDEQVWNTIKSRDIGRRFIKTKEELKKALHSSLRSLQHKANTVMSFFKLENTQYAAESMC